MAYARAIGDTSLTLAASKKESYHHGDLRRALTDAGLELLAEVGTAFTLRQAAARVGVVHSAAYRHFADKDALLAELSRLGYERLGASMRKQVQRAPHPRAAIEGILRAYLRFGWKHPAQYEVMFGRRVNEDGRFDALEAAISDVVGVLQSALAQHLESEDRARTRDAGIAIWSFAHGYTSSVLSRRIHVRSLAAAEAYMLLVAAPLIDGVRT